MVKPIFYIIVCFTEIKIIPGEGAGWDVGDDDLDLPEELASKMAVSETKDSGFFAPSKGICPSQIWTNNSQLVGDHVRAGSLQSAFRQDTLPKLFHIYFNSDILVDCCMNKLV